MSTFQKPPVKKFFVAVGWDESKWLQDLPWDVRYCWITILEYVKDRGWKGVVREPLPERIAASHGIVTESHGASRYVTALRSCIDAAVAHGAIEVSNGHWVIPNWTHYQGEDRTAAERQQRSRDKKRQTQNAQEEEDDPEEVTGASRPVTDGHAPSRKVTPPRARFTATSPSVSPATAGATGNLDKPVTTMPREEFEAFALSRTTPTIATAQEEEPDPPAEEDEGANYRSDPDVIHLGDAETKPIRRRSDLLVQDFERRQNDQRPMSHIGAMLGGITAKPIQTESEDDIEAKRRLIRDQARGAA